MPDALDPVSLVLRFLGAFYAFAGIVAGRAGLTSGVLDAALAGISGKSPPWRERALTYWLTASSWLVFASGVLLMVHAREAMWAFIFCSLTQAFYLVIAAPYYFDVEDPPDELGRRRTTNAFFVYLAATLLVIWASGRYLIPVTELHPALAWGAVAAILAFAAYLGWHMFMTSRMPKSTGFADLDVADPIDDHSDRPRPFDPRMLRIELSREGGASPLKNQKTREDIDPATLALSDSLRSNLMDWFRDGDPDMEGLAYNLAEQLAHECPEIAVAEPGIPNAYFNFAIASPYEDIVSSGPNWDRVTGVKIMCDYDCWPVWAANSGAVGCMPPSVLGVSGALETALLDWQDAFDMSIDRDNPAVPVWSFADAQAHERQGYELAVRVKRERPGLAVYVQSPRGVLIVDVATPPGEWVRQDSLDEGA